MKLINADIKNNLYISQSLSTIQGEGSKTGEPSYLIRFAFCNLKCPWCDSKYAWDYKKELPGNIIINNTEDFDDWVYNINILCEDSMRNIMITGGEPFLYIDNYYFLELLAQLNVETIEIETNGILINKLYEYYTNPPTFTMYNLEKQHVKSRIANLKLNISPKIDPRCYSSYEEFETSISKIKENIKKIKNIHECELKFVYDSKLYDNNELNDFIEDFEFPKNKIIIMPLTPLKHKTHVDNSSYIQKYIKDYCLPTLQFCMEYGYKFSPRIHVFLFEDCREDFN